MDTKHHLVVCLTTVTNLHKGLMIKTYKKLIVGIAMLCSVLGLIGCAGRGLKVDPSGSMTIGVTWPEAAVSRVVPIASNSIVVEVRKDGNLTNSLLITKPSTSAVLENLPLGEVTVTARAMPNTDGTGTAQAMASQTATIVEGPTNVINLTLASTIDHIQINSTATVTALQQTTIVATPKDSSNNTVLTAPGNILFTSEHPLVGTVNPTTGVFSGLLMGTTKVTATELDSNKSGECNVTVKVGVGIVGGGSVNVSILGTHLFVATVVGAPLTGVTWSVDGGAGHGSINALGLYVAPATSGTHTIRATSTADPTVSATVTVVVGSGGGIINIF